MVVVARGNLVVVVVVVVGSRSSSSSGSRGGGASSSSSWYTIIHSRPFRSINVIPSRAASAIHYFALYVVTGFGVRFITSYR